MSNTKKTFTLREVEQVVKFAYETGFCDGTEDKEYYYADDF